MYSHQKKTVIEVTQQVIFLQNLVSYVRQKYNLPPAVFKYFLSPPASNPNTGTV